MPARDPQDGFLNPLRRALRAGEGSPERHLDPEELLALRDGSLADDVEASLREHLSQCGDCATELLELEALFAGTAGNLPAAELDASWQRQREALASKPAEPVASVAARPVRRDRSRFVRLNPSWAWGIAASILAVVAVGQWRQIVACKGPRVNPPWVQLVPAGAVRRADPDAVPRIDREAPEPRLWLVLNPQGDLDHPPYAIEIRDGAGRLKVRVEGVAPTAAGNVHLDLARDSFGVGRHRIVILGGSSGVGSKPIEVFELDVGSPPQ